MEHPAAPVRVAIISRQEVVARGLVAMLSDYPDRVVVTSIPSTRSRAKRVQVILYDTIGLHHHNVSELEHLLHNTEARVLIFSRDMRPDLRALALGMGCEGWISMTTRSKELVEAIELFARGLPLPDQPLYLGEQAGLSQREVEVLALIAQGLSNAQITERLVLSANTLKTHVRNLYRKIGVRTRSQAVGWAMRNGFAPPD